MFNCIVEDSTLPSHQQLLYDHDRENEYSGRNNRIQHKHYDIPSTSTNGTGTTTNNHHHSNSHSNSQQDNHHNTNTRTISIDEIVKENKELKKKVKRLSLLITTETEIQLNSQNNLSEKDISVKELQNKFKSSLLDKNTNNLIEITQVLYCIRVVSNDTILYGVE